MDPSVLPSEVLVGLEGNREMYSPTTKIVGALFPLMGLWFMSIETIRYAVRRRNEYLQQLRSWREVAGIWATIGAFGLGSIVPCMFTLAWLMLQGVYAMGGAVVAIMISSLVWLRIERKNRSMTEKEQCMRERRQWRSKHKFN